MLQLSWKWSCKKVCSPDVPVFRRRSYFKRSISGQHQCGPVCGWICVCEATADCTPVPYLRITNRSGCLNKKRQMSFNNVVSEYLVVSCARSNDHLAIFLVNSLELFYSCDVHKLWWSWYPQLHCGNKAVAPCQYFSFTFGKDCQSFINRFCFLIFERYGDHVL